MRRFAATIRGENTIQQLQPIERWNISNITLDGSNNVQSLNGLYNGLNFSQANASQRPNFNGSEIVFTAASSHVLFNSNLPDVKTAQGEFIMVAEFNPNNLYLDIGTNSGTVNRFFFQSLTSDSLIRVVKGTSVKMQKPSLSIQYYIISFVSTGTSYRMYINNPTIQETISTPNTDNGEWTNSVTGTNVQIGRTAGTFYFNTKIKDYTYFDKLLTNAERTTVFNELNSLYSVY